MLKKLTIIDHVLIPVIMGFSISATLKFVNTVLLQTVLLAAIACVYAEIRIAREFKVRNI